VIGDRRRIAQKIWRAANLLIREHGDDAGLEAARRGPSDARMEADRSCRRLGDQRHRLSTVEAIRQAFDRAGLVFVDADADGGPGVRLKGRG
jgi:hypothetical protein